MRQTQDFVGFSVQQIVSLARESAAEMVAIAVVATLTALVAMFRKRVVHWLNAWRVLNNLKQLIASDADIWLNEPIPKRENGDDFRQSRILTIANLKGGVGKTTLAANLAAYFALEGQNRRDGGAMRVLLIDFDFQGSLSTMTLPQEFAIPHGTDPSSARKLIKMLIEQGQLTAEDLHSLAKPVAPTAPNFLEPPDRLWTIPAYYDFAKGENSSMIGWLIKSVRDIREPLAKTLQSFDVRQRYDIIIIDAPPRLTTASIMALSASTHLLVPTILDRLSGIAVGSFCEQVELHRKLWPHLQIIGIVGTMVSQSATLSNRELEGKAAIQAALEQVKDRMGLQSTPAEMLPESTYIPDKALFREAAGRRIIFAEPHHNQMLLEVKGKIRALGQEVWSRMNNAN